MRGWRQARYAGLPFVALLAAWSVFRWVESTAGPPPPSSASASRPPALVVPPRALPRAAARRVTPPEVLATAEQALPPWSLSFGLKETRIGRRWTDHRAVIEDRRARDVRSYAIGDLLPYGAVLVGVSTGTVQLMVADRELVRLDVGGRLRSVQDFRAAYERAALRRVKEDVRLQDAVQQVLPFLRSSDPAEVQGAIEALIDAGGPAVGELIPYVESQVAVSTSTDAYSFGGRAPRRPRVYGDLIVGILQAITGQSFGDPMAPELSDGKRAWIRAQWRRWWGATAQATSSEAASGQTATSTASKASTATVAGPATPATPKAMTATVAVPTASEVTTSSVVAPR